MTRPLNAGRLRERVQIFRSIENDTGSGGLVEVWTPIARVWAEVLAQPGREAVLDRALQGIAVYKVTIRWRSNIRASDQLRWNGQVLNIKAPPVDPDGKRCQLVITADTEAVQAIQ